MTAKKSAPKAKPRRSGPQRVGGKAFASAIECLGNALKKSPTPTQRDAAFKAINELVDGQGVTKVVGRAGRSDQPKAVAMYVERGNKPTVFLDLVDGKVTHETTENFFRRNRSRYKVGE